MDRRRGGGGRRGERDPQRARRAGLTDAIDYALIALITLVPFAFLLGLLRSNLGRAGAVSALVERVGGTSVRDALAEALGDPQLAPAYWLPEPGATWTATGIRTRRPSMAP